MANLSSEKQLQQEKDERLLYLIEEHQPLFDLFKQITQIEEAHWLARMGSVPLGSTPVRYGDLPKVDLEQFSASLLYLRGYKDGVSHVMNEIETRCRETRRRLEKEYESSRNTDR